ATADDVAVMLAYAHKVVFVPGYGLAVAQAQHDVRQLADMLEAKGVEVTYAIHPVAGRMPGHMNVLLAEANVPYTQLKEMDEANPEFSRTDVAVVVGANDVVNPDARTNQGSPIYGMPILNVDNAQAVVVLKRSMNPGFAGIENPLFYNPKTVMLAYAHKVVFVPGYGLAVAQAQHDVRQLADLLEAKGVEVTYAIHPVAGRMPGHMNVLLAEANVPYTQLKEMDDANPEFSRTDVAVVVGANDVVNPDARNNHGSPIYGMPILNVDNSQAVVVLKRSMNPGFAGIENPLFYNPKTVMLFGDAKQSITKLIQDVKAL
ncbi:MAG TPA: NAD(P)(+) transhydrogenase (Re/Si-specific) subunit beta, partial [Gaiellaceae bacterium]